MILIVFAIVAVKLSSPTGSLTFFFLCPKELFSYSLYMLVIPSLSLSSVHFSFVSSTTIYKLQIMGGSWACYGLFFFTLLFF